MTRGHAPNQFAVAVKTAIDTNPLSRLHIHDLVPQLYISRNPLLTAFRELTGKSIKRYRMEKRMETAREMLKAGELTVKQVAMRCGYKRQSNFSTDFKSVFAMTPAEWIRINESIS